MDSIEARARLTDIGSCSPEDTDDPCAPLGSLGVFNSCGSGGDGAEKSCVCEDPASDGVLSVLVGGVGGRLL